MNLRGLGGLLIAAALLPAGAATSQGVAEDGLAKATGAVLRGLDKVAGSSTDLPLRIGQTIDFGQLNVTLRECRYPANDPSSNAFAFLEIAERDSAKMDFQGWMIADSPALSALDHPRYDIWVIRCSNS